MRTICPNGHKGSRTMCCEMLRAWLDIENPKRQIIELLLEAQGKGQLLVFHKFPTLLGFSGPQPVTYLQHGLLTSARDWILNLPNSSSAFMLFEARYDVWMGNSWGSTWSRKNFYSPPDSSESWAFSFDEMAKYDPPATINFILEMTGHEQLYYVGHSQGSTIAFIAFSTDQALAEKVKALFALSPATAMKHMKSPLDIFLLFTKKMFKILFGDRAFFTNIHLEKFIATRICGCKVLDQICVNAIFIMCGYNQKNLNMSRLDMYLSHVSGTSVQTLFHQWQVRTGKEFQAYDWGSPIQNIMHFNQPTPPFYRAEDMTAPAFPWSGGNDWLLSPKDVEDLLHQLPNLVYHKMIPSHNHLDFIWGMDPQEQIYDDLVEMMTQNASSFPAMGRT
uniref:Lipase n=1 Tax=Vombatus ursinus TaxID=29139 RepID=A0A4X2M2P1_VOMUR